MTTLILDRRSKILYADQQETYGKAMRVPTHKIVPLKLKTKNYGWIALAGSTEEGETFLRYVSKLDDFEEIKDLNEKRPNWKKLGGIVVGPNDKTFLIGGDGTPWPIYCDYMTDGAGWEAALILLDLGINVPQIYTLLHNRTVHTSAVFDYIEYGKKNAKVIYDQIYTA